MKMLVCAVLAGVMVILCPLGAARADSTIEENAAAVVFRAMQGDIERCFARVSGNAFMRVEAVLDSGGRVRRVETTGDARASPFARRCVERRVARALFPAPRGGGTSRVRTSFVFALE